MDRQTAIMAHTPHSKAAMSPPPLRRLTRASSRGLSPSPAPDPPLSASVATFPSRSSTSVPDSPSDGQSLVQPRHRHSTVHPRSLDTWGRAMRGLVLRNSRASARTTNRKTRMTSMIYMSMMMLLMMTSYHQTQGQCSHKGRGGIIGQMMIR